MVRLEGQNMVRLEGQNVVRAEGAKCSESRPVGIGRGVLAGSSSCTLTGSS